MVPTQLLIWKAALLKLFQQLACLQENGNVALSRSVCNLNLSIGEKPIIITDLN